MNIAAGASLPLEIWTHIFNLACTDGGFTGCALSRVSRPVRATSAPMRYRTIVLAGPDQISGFAALLKEPPGPGVRRVIRHLFLLRREPASQDALCRRPRGPRTKASGKAMQARRRCLKEEQELMASIRPAVEHILDVAAPTLRTVGMSEFSWHGDLAVPASLPALGTLTHFGLLQVGERGARALFGGIPRVHLVGDVGKDVIARLGCMAPRLTHLEITTASKPGSFNIDGWLDRLSYSNDDWPVPPLLRDLTINVAGGTDFLRDDGRWFVKCERIHVVKRRLGWQTVSEDESSQTRECRRVGMLHDWLENASDA